MYTETISFLDIIDAKPEQATRIKWKDLCIGDYVDGWKVISVEVEKDCDDNWTSTCIEFERENGDWTFVNVWPNQFDEVASLKGDKKVLCDTWQCAVKNDCGVFTINTREYEAGTYGKHHYKLTVALLYPYIYYSYGYDTNIYGCSSPCMEDTSRRLSVFDGDNGIQAMTEALCDDIESDNNIDCKDKKKFLNLLLNCMEQFIKDS